MKRNSNRFLAATLSVAFALTLAPTSIAANEEASFRDVSQSHWAYTAVERMVSTGIVQGTSEGVYDPDGLVTYAQWAKMVVEMVHPDQCFHCCTQTLSDQWWGGYAGAAMDANLSINGRYLFADTVVHQLYLLGGGDQWLSQTMDSGISRYDMARVLYNMAIMMGLEDNGNNVTKQIGDWDVMSASYMAEAVHFCYANGILHGDQQGNFNGSELVTRAQAAAVLHRLLDVLEIQETLGDSPSKDEDSKSEDGKEDSKDEDTKDDSSGSKDDSSSSKDEGDKDSAEETTLLDQVLQALLDYLKGLTGNSDSNSNNNSNNNRNSNNNINQNNGDDDDDDDVDDDVSDNDGDDDDNDEEDDKVGGNGGNGIGGNGDKVDGNSNGGNGGNGGNGTVADAGVAADEDA